MTAVPIYQIPKGHRFQVTTGPIAAAMGTVVLNHSHSRPGAVMVLWDAKDDDGHDVVTTEQPEALMVVDLGPAPAEAAEDVHPDDAWPNDYGDSDDWHANYGGEEEVNPATHCTRAVRKAWTERADGSIERETWGPCGHRLPCADHPTDPPAQDGPPAAGAAVEASASRTTGPTQPPEGGAGHPHVTRLSEVRRALELAMAITNGRCGLLDENDPPNLGVDSFGGLTVNFCYRPNHLTAQAFAEAAGLAPGETTGEYQDLRCWKGEHAGVQLEVYVIIRKVPA
jgi:hypothetical protein